MSRGFILCGGDDSPGTRDECENSLHDYPLPNGYVSAAEEAARRLRKRWSNRRCSDCGLYGWVPSAFEDVALLRRPASDRTR